MPEARLGGAGIHVQTRIVLARLSFLGQFTRGPGTFRHTRRDPAFWTPQNFRRTMTNFLQIGNAHSAALFRIQLCEVTNRRGNRNQTARIYLNPLLSNSTAALYPSKYPYATFETAVLLLKGGAVLAVSGTLHRRKEARTFEIDGETCGPLSRRVHDRTSTANAEDEHIAASSAEQVVHCTSSGVKSVLDCGGKTNIPRPSCSIA